MTSQERAELEARFDDAMLERFVRAKFELRYCDSGMLDVLRTLGGFVAARMLLAWPEPSEEFAYLCAAGRLDLSTEQLVLTSPWRQLFTSENLDTARVRLRAFHGTAPPEEFEAVA